MTDYGKLFASKVQSKLKEKIIGNIFVTVTKEDTLYIQITRDGRDTQMQTYINNLSEKMLNGYSTDYAVYEIMKQYREHVTKIMEKRYFYGN